MRRCRHLVVDGNNVIGAVANGWWRDRPAAVRRLLARLHCLGEPATLVVDVAQPDLSKGDHGGIAIPLCNPSWTRRR